MIIDKLGSRHCTGLAIKYKYLVLISIRMITRLPASRSSSIGPKGGLQK